MYPSVIISIASFAFIRGEISLLESSKSLFFISSLNVWRSISCESLLFLSADKNSKDSQEIDLHTLRELIKKRDFEDSNREISPLIKANDAIEIITDGYTINEVVDKIVDLYNDKIPKETEIK